MIWIICGITYYLIGNGIDYMITRYGMSIKMSSDISRDEFIGGWVIILIWPILLSVVVIDIARYFRHRADRRN